MADLKTYLQWHLAHASAAALSAPFVNENFRFYGTTLTGRKSCSRDGGVAQQTDGDLAKSWARRERGLGRQPRGRLKMVTKAQLKEFVSTLHKLRTEYGRDKEAGNRKAAHRREQDRVSRQVA